MRHMTQAQNTANSWRLLALSVGASLAGCATVNSNPNILSEPPYTQITFVAEPDATYLELDTVEVTTRGNQANLLNTIPTLYRKALESDKHEQNALYLSNIQISSYTKKELFSVPYEECHTQHYTESELVQNCTGVGAEQQCSFDTRSVPKTREVCTTIHQTEIRHVLYQQAKATILRKQ